ncbi:MAG: exodeoxyribonuclease VII small subunit [Candidatus Saccharimonadales bacterium]
MANSKKAKTYQQMADDLASLVDWFESDQVNLDEAVRKYEQAMRLLDEMEDYLKSAQNKIKKIAVKFDSE